MVFVAFLHFSLMLDHYGSLSTITDHDGSWSIMMDHNWSWSIMIHHDPSWWIMIHHDRSWSIMIDHDDSSFYSGRMWWRNILKNTRANVCKILHFSGVLRPGTLKIEFRNPFWYRIHLLIQIFVKILKIFIFLIFLIVLTIKVDSRIKFCVYWCV